MGHVYKCRKWRLLGAASGSLWVVFVGGRALMSHLKANVRFWKVQEREADEEGETAGIGENSQRGEGVWDWEARKGGAAQG